MPASPTVATAAQAETAAATVQPTFAEQLTTSGRVLWDHLLRLDARDAGLNVLLTLAVAAVAFGAIWLLRRLFDRCVAHFDPSRTNHLAEGARRPIKAAGVTWGLLRLLVFAAAALIIMSVWGIDPWAWLSNGAGARLLRLALIVVLSTALVEAA